MGAKNIRLTFISTLLIISVAVIEADNLQKSIVYNKNNPDFFYCPQSKPTNMKNMIVKSVPLSKLCEFEGGDIPDYYKSDCYNDIDETPFACNEKLRIMKLLRSHEI